MSVLFSSIRIGELEIANRFVHSATAESMAETTGEVTDQIIKRYRNLARGGVGLIIPGYMYVQRHGRGIRHQLGIHSDAMIPGLERLAEVVHQEQSKLVFQLAHTGRQTTKALIGTTPVAPSSVGRDPSYQVKPRAMSEQEIHEVIAAFAAAAVRAVTAGADGVQLHAAHGYLINQFLSPFFNRRRDSWGGSEENRFRFLSEIILAIRGAIGSGVPILIKLNTHDHTPGEGIKPPLAVAYARRLAALGIAAVEISSGTTYYSFMPMCRGEVPVRELVRSLPWWKKPLGHLMIGRLAGKYDHREAYHLEAAELIKPVLEGIPLALVGGLRTAAKMEEVITQGKADLISLSRPLIREPFLVARIRDGKTDRAKCESCNRCLAGLASNLPVRCYPTPSGDKGLGKN